MGSSQLGGVGGVWSVSALGVAEMPCPPHQMCGGREGSVSDRFSPGEGQLSGVCGIRLSGRASCEQGRASHQAA